ncbi:16S rRNA (uracil(1498)-N(3))-methyltransferase [Marinomonas posidonica]|uniref:Ribosomal RNA small subunit methyltransferase E n=1 Tax=Marinomonas posidonica (strain CECT 7376 / NCIMB 14433 / IVIA-Po-181) TaxID=491952 RepID=F6CUK1_MARPP|nr:16S rRNA (uracil(1498)-N(3))-methyltransferase [Marinomonas posidonica]AEF56421.1 Ribosomal RNA small subunit methyltransferase E [Marinomonas posidonica IVIA-Po-181]
MRIPRIFIDIELSENATIALPDTSFQHLCKVLRLKSGHPIRVFNGLGGQFHATLCDVEKRTASIAIGAFEALNNESAVKVTIGQTLSRGERMDYAIQKSVEAGVFAIQPLLSERCEVKLEDKRMQKRLSHWQQVATSAAEQCGRGIVPIVHPPLELTEWVGDCNDMLKFTLHHHSAKPIKQFDLPTHKHIALLIGPEGGLTENEVQHSEKQGFNPITLGPRVLRTETAPVVALSVIQTLWGDIH